MSSPQSEIYKEVEKLEYEITWINLTNIILRDKIISQMNIFLHSEMYKSKLHISAYICIYTAKQLNQSKGAWENEVRFPWTYDGVKRTM